jgi:hypothetical protein
MMRLARVGVILRAAMVSAALLGPVVPVAAQTVLLVIQESAAGRPLAAPLPLREGLAASLFDSGIIVFDLPGVTPASGADEISRLAQRAGADFILKVQADYADTQSSGNVSISAHVTWSLLVSATGKAVAAGSRDASNRGREHDVDRAALGAEIAVPVVEEVRKALNGWKPPA